jgi:Domain of unknown function (DUF4136)
VRPGRLQEERVTKEGNMKILNRLKFLPAFLLIVVCVSGQDVHYNYDRGTNFESYKTYQWVDLPGDAVPDQLIHQSIRRAVDEQLAQKGLTKVERNADLFIAYHAKVFEEKGINLNAWGMRGPGGTGINDGTISGSTSSIPVGVIVVDLFDPARKQLIWRGDASNTINLKKDPDKNYRTLQKAMTKLFKNYPPPPKK